MNIKAIITRHAILTYFLLAYTITWLGILILTVPGGFATTSPTFAQVGMVFLAMLLGPSSAGLLMTAIVDGRAGLSQLFQRMRRWRVGLRWYAIAVLTMPLLSLVILGALNLFVSPEFAPGFVAFGIIAGLAAGFIEEIGWTGFATHNLLGKHGALATGLVIGLLWGVWHGLSDFWGRGASLGGMWLPIFLVFVASVSAYRILMTWVYENTRSVLVAQIMHAFYTGSLAVLGPVLAPEDELLWTGSLAVVLWIVVAVLAYTSQRRKVQQISGVPTGPVNSGG